MLLEAAWKVSYAGDFATPTGATCFVVERRMSHPISARAHAASLLAEILALTEFSEAAYLADAGGWQAIADDPLATLLAEYDSERRQISIALHEAVLQLGGARTVTCFGAELTNLNDLNRSTRMERLAGWSAIRIRRLAELVGCLDSSSTFYEPGAAALRLERSFSRQLKEIEAGQAEPAPSVDESPKPAAHLPRTLTIQIAIDIGRTFVMRPIKTDEKRPIRTEPRARWSECLQPSGFKPFLFPSIISTPPTPLGWAGRISVDDDDLKCLSSVLEPLHIPGDSLSADIILFTTGIGFLIVRTRLSDDADLAVINLESKELLGLLGRSNRELCHRLRRYCDRFITVLASDNFSELLPLRRPFARKAKADPELIGSYSVLLLANREPIVSQTRLKPKRTLELMRLGLAMHVGWEFACVWPLDDVTQLSNAETLEIIVLAANVAWFGYVIMDQFVAKVAEEMFVEDKMAGRNRILDVRSLHKVRLAYLQAADAMRALRWTRWDPELEVLQFISDTWGTAKHWQTVEERVQLLVVHAQESENRRKHEFEGRIVRFGFILAAGAITSAVTDLYEFHDKVPSSWYTAAAICGPLLVIAMLYYVARKWESGPALWSSDDAMRCEKCQDEL